MLKNIGTKALTYLTELLNISGKTLMIPNIWKVGRVIPLIKSGKPIDQGTSFRPISLLSPIAKLMEKLIQPDLSEHFLLADHQHGFRKIHNYIQGRQTYVDFRDKQSKRRKVKQGVPQGGVLSPLLFNLYLRNIPTPPPGIQLVSYADDCTILATGTNIPVLCHKLNCYLELVSKWLKEQHLELSPGKSSATLFTLWTKEVNFPLDMKIDNIQVPINKNPKILGVTFDPSLTFHHHTKNIKDKLQSRNNVLKTLAGTSWGKDKETLMQTYKAIGRPMANYAAPIYIPQLKPTNWKLLQKAQNAALRTITGCHKLTHEDHLHQETNILRIKDHTVMIAAQYTLKCHHHAHPNYILTTLPDPPRSIRKSAITKYRDCINILSPPTTQRRLRRGIRTIHSSFVDQNINSYQNNRTLGRRPPKIN